MILRLPDGRAVVGGNSFDLVAGDRPAPPEVSVIIPYYEAQQQLDLVLTGLSMQTHPQARLEVIVADDGSRESPDLTAAQGISSMIVSQERAGFRAAAARNLGASVAAGTVLCFLDGDTIPTPEYIANLTRLPAVLPDALVVGRREHGDLSGWTPTRLRQWFAHNEGPPSPLGVPAWLADGYSETHDLLDADERSFRYVISAVLGIGVDLFRELGGFDAGFTSYGGEDWELGFRAWNAGGVLAHVPGAVAWHDGPEWAERGGDREAKNRETLELAARIPQVDTRAGNVRHARERYVVTFDNSRCSDAATVITVDSALRFGDVSVWLTRAVAYLCDDPRVSVGYWNGEGGSLTVDVADACVFEPRDLMAVAGRLTVSDDAGCLIEVTSRRAARRTARWAGQFPDRDLMADLFGEQTRAPGEVSARRLPAEPDLAAYFASRQA